MLMMIISSSSSILSSDDDDECFKPNYNASCKGGHPGTLAESVPECPPLAKIVPDCPSGGQSGTISSQFALCGGQSGTASRTRKEGGGGEAFLPPGRAVWPHLSQIPAFTDGVNGIELSSSVFNPETFSRICRHFRLVSYGLRLFLWIAVNWT